MFVSSGGSYAKDAEEAPANVMLSNDEKIPRKELPNPQTGLRAF